MDLELDADPDAVADLIRLKPLAATRQGRPRTQTVKTLWHDSPDHALFGKSLILAHHRGIWQIERIVPSSATWLPAQPPPVLETAADRAALTANLPGILAPIAAFEGRRTVSLHQMPDAPSPLSLSVERGVLRSVTAEHGVARITLSGDEQAVRAAALLIAGAIRVSVPCASLAAQAIALATGGAPSPRHLGAPLLPRADMAVTDALAHILGHLTDVVLHYAPVAAEPVSKPSEFDGKTHDDARIEAVHQMRVAVRRALSAISVFREALPEGALEPVRVGLKALATNLGHTRDWDVFVGETAPVIAEPMAPDERLDRMIVAAKRRRQDCRRTLADFLTSTAFRSLTIELAWFAAARFWHVAPLSIEPVADTEDPPPIAELPSIRDFAPVVLQQRWKKLLSAGKNIEDLDIPSLHGLRLRAKRARYAAEMFSVQHEGKAAQRFIRRLSLLQQRLGTLNDGAVAAHLLQELGGPAGKHAYAVGVVTGFTASSAGKIRPRIIRAFEKLRRQPAYWP
jgi:triphosphatase